MRRNALHPDRIVRRLRTAALRLTRTEHCDDVAYIVRRLRNEAEHQDWCADLWETGDTAADLVHVACHCRRIARRLRDTAEAIERDHAAGPWIALGQPIVDLSEARPASQEAH